MKLDPARRRLFEIADRKGMIVEEMVHRMPVSEYEEWIEFYYGKEG